MIRALVCHWCKRVVRFRTLQMSPHLNEESRLWQARSVSAIMSMTVWQRHGDGTINIALTCFSGLQPSSLRPVVLGDGTHTDASRDTAVVGREGLHAIVRLLVGYDSTCMGLVRVVSTE